MEQMPRLQKYINTLLVAQASDTNNYLCTFIIRGSSMSRLKTCSIYTIWNELYPRQAKVMCCEVVLHLRTQQHNHSMRPLEQGACKAYNRLPQALQVL